MVDLKKRLLSENENPHSRSNQEQGTDKFINRRQLVKGNPIAVVVEARAKTQKGGILTGGNYTDLHYHPPTRKRKFWKTLMMAWNGCSETMEDP